MIAAVVTDKNERMKLSPRVAALVAELVEMAESIESFAAGSIQADFGGAELHCRLTEVRARVKVARS